MLLIWGGHPIIDSIDNVIKQRQRSTKIFNSKDQHNYCKKFSSLNSLNPNPKSIVDLKASKT